MCVFICQKEETKKVSLLFVLIATTDERKMQSTAQCDNGVGVAKFVRELTARNVTRRLFPRPVPDRRVRPGSERETSCCSKSPEWLVQGGRRKQAEKAQIPPRNRCQPYTTTSSTDSRIRTAAVVVVVALKNRARDQ